MQAHDETPAAADEPSLTPDSSFEDLATHWLEDIDMENRIVEGDPESVRAQHSNARAPSVSVPFDYFGEAAGRRNCQAVSPRAGGPDSLETWLG